VKLLLEFKKLGLLLRNVDGDMPLHLAAQKGYAEITKLVVEASPTEALHAENGVGQTAIETATLRELLLRIGGTFNLIHRVYRGGLESTFLDITAREVEIVKLRATLDQLLQEGRLKRGTKTTTELLAFATMMEAKLATAKSRNLAAPSVDKKAPLDLDVVDHLATLQHIRVGISARPGPRHLVHLFNVQRSVAGSLAAVNEAKKTARVGSDMEGEEEDEEEEQKRNSLVCRMVVSYTT
jgi:hypothetical protein